MTGKIYRYVWQVGLIALTATTGLACRVDVPPPAADGGGTQPPSPDGCGDGQTVIDGFCSLEASMVDSTCITVESTIGFGGQWSPPTDDCAGEAGGADHKVTVVMVTNNTGNSVPLRVGAKVDQVGESEVENIGRVFVYNPDTGFKGNNTGCFLGATQTSSDAALVNTASPAVPLIIAPGERTPVVVTTAPSSVDATFSLEVCADPPVAIGVASGTAGAAVVVTGLPPLPTFTGTFNCPSDLALTGLAAGIFEGLAIPEVIGDCAGLFFQSNRANPDSDNTDVTPTAGVPGAGSAFPAVACPDGKTRYRCVCR